MGELQILLQPLLPALLVSYLHTDVKMYMRCSTTMYLVGTL